MTAKPVVLWFKRDLRLYDHAALTKALQQGPVIPLYIIEPEYWQLPDTSQRHWQFIKGALTELHESLQNLGSGLIIRTGNAAGVLDQLQQQTGFTALFSHMETGNYWTFERDRAVNKWCYQNNIKWYQAKQFGVWRGPLTPQTRDKWASRWDNLMAAPPYPIPTKLHSPLALESLRLPTAAELELKDCGIQALQPPGRGAGLALLNSFLYERGEPYQKAMSSPVTAFDTCSRLSPHLTYGTLSMREVYQAALKRQAELKAQPPAVRGKWLGALRAFIGRLHWHCHFIQKLESEPRLEYENMSCAFDGLRENDFNLAHFRAWQTGQTGYPLIDACMRALIATGYLNFRMRAMVVSFASYHLWLDWRRTAPYLARLFNDYEPGIHYSQFQMQSGTTGMNTIRVYNPINRAKSMIRKVFLLKNGYQNSPTYLLSIYMSHGKSPHCSVMNMI